MLSGTGDCNLDDMLARVPFLNGKKIMAVDTHDNVIIATRVLQILSYF